MHDKRDEILYSMKNQIQDKEKFEKLEEIAEAYKDKSEDEIFVEIIKLNEEMEETLGEDKYNEILGKLDSIRPFLSEEQNKKLDFILKAMNKE